MIKKLYNFGRLTVTGNSANTDTTPKDTWGLEFKRQFWLLVKETTKNY